MGMLVFLGVAALVAIACHHWIRPFLLALLISGPVAAIVFQVVVTIQLGRQDPLWLIAFLTTTLTGWVVSLLVGLAMRCLPFDRVPMDAGASDPLSPAQDEEQGPSANRRRE